MARRKRREEEAIWEPPEFDEVGYMRQEIQNAKIAMVVVAWAVAGAILAYLVALWIPIVGYLIGLAAFGALYFILPAVGLPIHGFKRRDWISHASVYFFSWLAFSIILLNAPFGDHTAPVVGSFEVGSFNPPANLTLPAENSTTCFPSSAGGTVHVPAASNRSLYIQFRATDNVEVASIQVKITTTIGTANATYTDVGGQTSACASNPRQSNLVNTYAVTTPTGPSNILVSITAVDGAGLSTTETFTVLSS